MSFLKTARWTCALFAFAALAACGGGSSGAKKDGGGTADGSIADAATDGAPQDAAPIDAQAIDAARAPDGGLLISIPAKLMWTQGSGIKKVSGGGRSLYLLMGQPLVKPFGASPNDKIEPGLFPQTKIH